MTNIFLTKIKIIFSLSIKIQKMEIEQKYFSKNVGYSFFLILYENCLISIFSIVALFETVS